MDMLLTADFWIGILKIIGIDVLLSGDNAIVIALAARGLPPAQQRKAILWGCGFAIVLRVALTLVAAKLMQFPGVELVGGALLLWIGIGLLKGDEPESDASSQRTGGTTLLTAIRTILLADLVMCLDNVIAVAAAAQGNFGLLLFGLAVSIPLVVFGSTVMIKLMHRFTWIVPAGAALIGWIAGETIVNDHLLQGISQQLPALKYVAAVCCAALVFAVGKHLQQRASKSEKPPTAKR